MRFLSILLAQAALAILCFASPMAMLDHSKDGIYFTANYLNGTSETTKFSAALQTRSTVSTVEHVIHASNGLNKRLTACRLQNLNPYAVDQSVELLRNWAGVGGHFMTSSADSNLAISATWGGAQAYYCIDAHSASGNLNIDDINYALGQMESACGRYRSAYYKWPGSVELVGIDALSVKVCADSSG